MDFNLENGVFDASPQTKPAKKTKHPLRQTRYSVPAASTINGDHIGIICLILETIVILVFWKQLFRLTMLVLTILANAAGIVCVVGCAILMIPAFIKKLFK